MKKLMLVVIILASLLPACKKEMILSPAEKTAVELQEVIIKNGIKRVIPWQSKSGSPDQISPGNGVTWEFSNGFFIVYDEEGNPGKMLNLLYLNSYEMRDATLTDSSKSLTLFLHFKD